MAIRPCEQANCDSSYSLVSFATQHRKRHCLPVEALCGVEIHLMDAHAPISTEAADRPLPGSSPLQHTESGSLSRILGPLRADGLVTRSASGLQPWGWRGSIASTGFEPRRGASPPVHPGQTARGSRASRLALGRACCCTRHGRLDARHDHDPSRQRVAQLARGPHS